MHGLDVSPNHSAVVELDDHGAVIWYNFVVQETAAGRPPPAVKKHQGALALPQVSDGHRHSADRIRRYPEIFAAWLRRQPDVVGAEDYAYSQPHKAHQIGEVGALLRQACLRTRTPYCLWSPGSIKKYATGNGNADKDQMVAAALKRWGVDFSVHGKVAAQDLADALACAKLTWATFKLAEGAPIDSLGALAYLGEKANKKSLEVLRSCAYDPIS